jgi:hypothetical protein
MKAATFPARDGAEIQVDIIGGIGWLTILSSSNDVAGAGLDELQARNVGYACLNIAEELARQRRARETPEPAKNPE